MHYSGTIFTRVLQYLFYVAVPLSDANPKHREGGEVEIEKWIRKLGFGGKRKEKDFRDTYAARKCLRVYTTRRSSVTETLDRGTDRWGKLSLHRCLTGHKPLLSRLIRSYRRC